jgi:hypothetical protein
MTNMDTEQPAESGPTLAEVLAAVNTLAADVSRRFDQVDTTAEGIRADVGQFRTEVGVKFDMVSADIAQLRADVLHAKVDASLAEARAKSAHDALNRHVGDPNAHGRDAA